MKFRIVTPSLNQAPYIERCVRSVMGQARDGIELDYLVLDAESTDGSIDILRGLQAEYPQMRLVVERDAGQADALRKGFAGVGVDIFGWLNADDVLLARCLARVSAVFAESSADVVYGRAWFIDADDRITGAYPVAPFDEDYLRTFCFLSQPSTFFRRRAYDDAGGVDPELQYCMDYGLWLRLAKAGAAFSFLPEYLSATRLHGATKTSTGALAFTDEVLATLRREFGSVPLEWLTYRRFRQLCSQKPGRPDALLLAAALRETAHESGQWGRLAVWAARVFRDHTLARAAWIRQSPKRL